MHEINCTIIVTSLPFVVNNNSHYIAKLSEFVTLNMLKRPLHRRPRRRKNQVSLASSLSTRKKIDILLRAFHQAL